MSAASRPPRVTLLTDFGTADGYVAAMKGVIAARAPRVILDDVSHDLSQGDVRGGMWALGRYWRLYPPGTVHLVVVDPGVGTGRRALALEAHGRFVVAPDNGVASHVMAEAETVRAVALAGVEPPVEEPSHTFHGRDVFAPAAGELAAGEELSSLGEPWERLVVLEGPHPTRERKGVKGEVVRVDRFGNLITNIPGEWVGSRAYVDVAGRTLPFRSAYGYGEPGSPLALINSDRLVEVAVRDGSAAEVLGVGVGAPVVVTAD